MPSDMDSQAGHRELGIVGICAWVLRYTTRRWVPFSALLLSMLVKVALDVLKPWPMVFLIDYVLQAHVMPEWLGRWVAILPGTNTPQGLAGWSVGATVVIFLLSWATGLANAYAGISLGQRIVYDVAADLFARLQKLSLRFHAHRGVGDSIRRLTADCGCASIVLKDVLVPLVSSVVTLVTIFAITWQIDATLTLLSMAVVPYMIVVFRRYARPMLELSFRQQEIESRIYELVEQTFSAIPVVQAFCREPFHDQRFVAAAQNTLTATLDLTRVQLRFKIWMGLATAVGTTLIIWFGSQHALNQNLQLGSMVAFLSYLGSLYAPIEALMYTNSTLQGAAGSARRVWEVLQTEPEVQDHPRATALRNVRGHVRFKQVTFGYRPGHPVLQGITQEIQPGEMVALVGATGAGKSTLVSLLPRFFDPWEGQVLVDDRDLREVTLSSLRRQVALVLQEPFLFPMSVAENIAYGKRDATAAEIETASRMARAHEFVVQLPDGYNTVLGERGINLSVGQRQRLSIARALLKNAPILILDEPTSALDAETESAFLSALDHGRTHCTTLIIAHRLSTIRRANRIIVLEAGRIAEFGAHDELLRAGGIYARLYALQFGPEPSPTCA